MNKEVVLKDIHTHEQGSHEADSSAYKALFPGTDRLKIDWFTGIVTISYGEQKEENNWDPEGIVLFEIREGKIVTERDMSYSEYVKLKRSQYELFKKTSEYNTALERVLHNNRRANYPDSFADTNIEEYIFEYIKRLLPEK